MGTAAEIADTGKPIVLFDGVCNLCNASVNFIIDRDPGASFRFASLQQVPDIGELVDLGASAEGLSSIILIEEGKIYNRSTAALRIAKKLSGGWWLLYGFVVIPTPIRDWVYDIIAKNRYRWFGRQESCRVPTKDLQSRFIA